MAWQKDQGKSAKRAAERAEQQANIAEGVIEDAQEIIGNAGKVTQDASAAARLASEKAEYITTKQPSIEKAITDSTEAKGKSTEAKTTADSVKAQFDRVVAEAGSNNPEVVQARGNEVNLNARFEKVTTQLADKANKSEVRLKTTKISQADVTEEFLQQMAGNAPINAVPLNESVTHAKTDFLKTTRNLFDKTKIIDNQKLSVAGVPSADEAWVTSEFIKVESGKEYKRSHTSIITLYKEDGTYVTGFGGGTTPFIVHSTAKLAKVSLYKNNLTAYQLEIGTVTTAYQEFAVNFPTLRVDVNNLSPLLSGFNNFQTVSSRENGKLKSIKVMDGANILEETVFNRDVSGRVTSIAITKNGRTVTTTINRDVNGKYLSETNATN